MPCSRSEGRDHHQPQARPAYRVSVTALGVLTGLAALVWLLVRTGTRPSRLSYPCQQASLAAATAVFGGPFVTAAVAGNARARRYVATGRGRLLLAGLSLSLLLWMGWTGYEPGYQGSIAAPPDGYRATVFSVNYARGPINGGFGGVDDLILLMGADGRKWYASADDTRTSGPAGLIAADDVVLIKVNAQWAQRGGTNSDVLRGIVARIVDHPDGFTGEIVVADNGQGSGNLDRTENNAEDITQSVQDVVDDFALEGWRVSTKLWDLLRQDAVAEYQAGDYADGYVVSPALDPETSIRASYPKFQTDFGSYVSYKHGIWSAAEQTYDADRLVVINVPVLKTHSIYAVTAAVKNHMGVITQSLSTDSHRGVGRGGMGTVLAEVRMPDLTILDCIWILARPGSGPSAYYGSATRRDQLLAGDDPVALDMWATAHVLIPEIIANGYGYESYATTQDPDNSSSVFRTYLDRSLSEMVAGGIESTNQLGAIEAHVWAGDADLDGDLDTFDWSDLALCAAGPNSSPDAGCEAFDFNDNAAVDLEDMARFLNLFTGSLSPSE